MNFTFFCAVLTNLLTLMSFYGKLNLIKKWGDTLKNKSFFSQIILLIVLALVCIVLTVGVALFAGSFNTTFFDLRNLNFANMIPVLIIGGFISCVVIGITVLYVSRSVFLKVRDNFIEINKKDGGNEQ